MDTDSRNDPDFMKLKGNMDFHRAIFNKNIREAQGIAFRVLRDREKVFKVVDAHLRKQE